MKNLMKDIKIGLLFVGTIVGAGFASGRELLSFFGHSGVYLIPLAVIAGALFFFTGWLFLKLGRIIQPKSFNDITKAVFGKGAKVMDVMILVSYFIVFSAMLAGVDALVKDAFHWDLGFPVFGILTAIVSVFIILRGMDGLINANSILVPIIVTFIFAVSLTQLINPENSSATPLDLNRNMGGNVWVSLVNVFLYVSMNMLLTASVLGSAGRNLNNRSVRIGSGVGAGIITVSIILILFALFTADILIFEADLPMLYLAGKYGQWAKIIAAIIIMAGVFTTLTSSIYPIVEWADTRFKRRSVTIPIILAIGFVISLLGFSGIVDLLYPVMGAIGLFFIGSAYVYYLKNRKKAVVPDTSENASEVSSQ